VTDDPTRAEAWRYLNNLRVGEEIVIDGKRYARCKGCRQIIRTDKFLVGSLHLCDE
jgi:hypothetical protein